MIRKRFALSKIRKVRTFGKTYKKMAVIVEIEEKQGRELLNYLKTLPYVTLRRDGMERGGSGNWQSLQGKYAGSGITSSTLATENENEKSREQKKMKTKKAVNKSGK